MGIVDALQFLNQCSSGSGDHTSKRDQLSSANMTSFALSLNIELGVLLNGGDAPRQMERNLSELIRTGVLREHRLEA